MRSSDERPLTAHQKLSQIRNLAFQARWDMTDRNSVRNLIAAVVANIEAGRAVEAPFFHLEFDRVFPDDTYGQMVANMPNAELIPVPSIWGHFAGGPGTNPKDVDFLDAKLKQLLAS